MTTWDKLADRGCRVLDGLCVACLAAMVVMVFGNVVLRYVFNSGITISEELSRWLFVWMTFLGAISAVREHGHLGTDVGQILEHEPSRLVDHDRARGHEHRQVAAPRALPVGRAARLAGVGPPLPPVGQHRERVDARLRPEDHAAAVAAVAAIRPAAGDVFLAAETTDAATPVAGGHLDLDSVDEHDWPSAVGGRPRLGETSASMGLPQRGPCEVGRGSQAVAAATTLTRRPSRSNMTVPSVSAKSV